MSRAKPEIQQPPNSSGIHICVVCGSPYPVRDYSLHKMQDWHQMNMASVIRRQSQKRQVAEWAARRQFMVSAYKTGMGLSDIGMMMGVTRQRVTQALKREGAYQPNRRTPTLRTCFIDGQDYQSWRMHSKDVAHTTAERVIIGHIRTSPYTGRLNKSEGKET